jgi:YesN/AraC family two-component response regulator
VSKKTLFIPIETENSILDKLKRFETTTRFTHKDMSLAYLASQFDTNTKYLSEVINKHKGRHFNIYINELRVKYIIEKLKKEPLYLNYKVSYLAKESGFASHSNFATVFRSITGTSPTTFINLLKREIQSKRKNTEHKY